MKKVPLHGKNAPKPFFIVDDEDHARVSAHHWCSEKRGRPYACLKIGERWEVVRASHFVLGFLNKKDRKGLWVDHINRNSLDNRKENLRLVSPSSNSMNRSLASTNTSGFKGISLDKESGKWIASIIYEKKHHYLGRFKTKIEAAIAYNEKARELCGDFVYLNEISPEVYIKQFMEEISFHESEIALIKNKIKALKKSGL